MRRRLRIAKVRLLRRIGDALSPYIWPPALVDRVTTLEENIGSQGADTPARRIDRIEEVVTVPDDPSELTDRGSH